MSRRADKALGLRDSEQGRETQVLDKVRAVWLMPFIDAVRAKVDQPIPLEGEINVVITGYLTSHIERYWKEGKDENRI